MNEKIKKFIVFIKEQPCLWLTFFRQKFFSRGKVVSAVSESQTTDRDDAQEKLSEIVVPVRKVVSLFLILIFLTLVGGYFLLTKTSFLDLFSGKEAGKRERNIIDEPVPVYNFFRLIDGVGVSEEGEINPPIFAVQIENMVDARPLSGVSRANLVYETLAEAGITRLLAFYTSDNVAGEIGPVRSARLYFLDWVEEYGALYAHSGGSPEALAAISKYDLIDLNEFSNGKYFWRSKNRYAPHNLYTSSENLEEAFVAKTGKVKKDFDSWDFKDEADFDGRPSEERRIKINFSTKTYEVGWQYDREENNYLRYQAGVIQQDRDGQEVRAKNIVVQFTKINVIDGVGRKKIQTIGEGDGIVFRDGVRIEGFWKKSARGERTKFYDSSGIEIKFNPGVTWVEVVPINTEVEF